MKIIPAIDLLDGKCVRLYKGDFAKSKIYNENPVEQAKAFEDAGIEFLHLVDLSGAKVGEPKHFRVLENVCKSTKLQVDFGGGLRSEQNLIDCFNSGANQVNVGTILIRNPELVPIWISKFGTEKLIASVDVINNTVKIAGWQEESGLGIFQTLGNLLNEGFTYFTVTDIDKDGTLSEPNLKLYKELLLRFPSIKLNASGGISSQDQLKLLNEIGCHGAIVGKAIYEGRMRLVD